MARFPHEFTMKKYHLIETDLNEDANEALQDFENFLSHLTDLKSKAGEVWTMTQDQQKKLNRLSRAVCMEIEYMVDESPPERVLEKPVEKRVEEQKIEIKEEKPDTTGESGFNIFSGLF